MILTEINMDKGDSIRKEEQLHELRLKRELKKHNIVFDYSEIAPHGMRVRSPKPKTESEKYKNFLENKLNIKIY